MFFEENVREIQWKISFLANVLENADSSHFISIFCQRIKVINITFCYTAYKVKSGENSVSQEILKLKNNGHLIND